MDLWRASKAISVALLLICCVAARPVVVPLATKDFEHQTQAATGQTTGVWYILFSSSEEPSLRWLQDVWQEAAEADLKETPRIQWATVDTATDPALGDRFSVTAPAVLLLRHRKVFQYGNSDLSPEALRRFARAPDVPGRAVPPPPGALDLALQALRGNELAVLLLKAAFVALAVAAAAGVTLACRQRPPAAPGILPRFAGRRSADG
ncbi:hypothetical protein WJX81_008536 [Elliptochloris bilobata]|uniref:Thioredoxin domain-containing protein n=1 Tax=Elliptochloris bilobata TaxID=381761 RepID=A0AAW1SAI2_9CHLO